MKNFYRTSDGDILPFHQIIRVMQMSDTTRILFVNGSVDLYKNEEFLTAYESWLQELKS